MQDKINRKTMLDRILDTQNTNALTMRKTCIRMFEECKKEKPLNAVGVLCKFFAHKAIDMLPADVNSKKIAINAVEEILKATEEIAKKSPKLIASYEKANELLIKLYKAIEKLCKDLSEKIINSMDSMFDKMSKMLDTYIAGGDQKEINKAEVGILLDANSIDSSFSKSKSSGISL